ncbi:MAG TPA: fatty acid synthase subunit beta domain-containing protein [Aeromicrobium sp.]|nr:fatty acid synthase subunit beta domain-containing protein [Aeromicrobium sp.]
MPLSLAEVEERLTQLPASARVVARMRNGRRMTVIAGPAAGIAKARELFEDVAAEPVDAALAFHHGDLGDAADLVAQWAERCGLDPELGRGLAERSIIDPVDWVASLDQAMESGARWLLDLGPSDLAARLSAREARSRGVGVVAVTTRRGLRELTAPGAAPQLPRSWSSFAPTSVVLPDGSVRVETAFTRLTGRSPVLLAGMTPTTVDPPIVAAAANAGFWAELAGGGQVNEEIFATNVAQLGDLLDAGRSYAFNALYLDPYLWRLHVGGRRLVQRARAAGAAVDAVVITAGIPERDEAVELVAELRSAGFAHVVFKPGTVAQIRDVLAIADAVDGFTLMLQIEGGKAGGHHSWEDLDELLIATYGEMRRRDNIVVCVGGGIGTPAAAAEYITGAWAERHGYPPMPVDGVLIGTAAMAALEATTSPAVKQLLVETTADGVVSGRSQLGADIHEIDNTASRTGRLLDEVAGDAAAVAARRDEIIAGLDRTAKPYFGDVAAMTYREWLERFAGLCRRTDQPDSHPGEWLDLSLRDRFHAMLQRAEARLAAADNGQIPTLFAEPADVDDADAAMRALVAAHASAETVLLHPADVPFFVEVCRRPGKPVPFVPVVDADVRRWWRSDSLWQAHDDRYSADAVCIIPGPVSVEGITRADEPIAELLQRFEDEVVRRLVAEPIAVVGRRRADGASRALALALDAPDVVWTDRLVSNPVRRLGADWVIVDADRAEQAETEAVLQAVSATEVELTVPLGDGTLRLRLVVDEAVGTGAAPRVVNAPEAMRSLLEIAAGDGGQRAWHPDLAADHAGVTPIGGGDDGATRGVLDAVVGLAWPVVFAEIGKLDAVEGMLDLVHLDHSICGELPSAASELPISATVRDVSDTEVGRVVTVAVHVGDTATMVERFAIRGRVGDAPLDAPASAGGLAEHGSDTPRRDRGTATVTAPTDMRAFAHVSGDHNPIHTSIAAARLAGLPGPIVHGMWLSATAQRVVTQTTRRALSGWTARFFAPVLPGTDVAISAQRVGIVDGDEIVEVVARCGDDVVLQGSGRLAAPVTAYAFPGQGIQHAGMGMEGYRRSAAAKDVWDRADAHTKAALGFSILQVVRDNPTDITAEGIAHRHPDGVLFLTQFTQVAMAVLAAAQMAELREAGVYVDGAIVAGHSVGEYNALAAVSGVISLEAIIEVVFQRGSVMHTLVPRDADGRSNYRLAAIRPSQIDVADDEVRGFIEEIATDSGEFLEIANYNLRGSQYAIAGTVRGCELLEKEVERRRAAAGGRAAFVLVPGIDVPFHSAPLRAGVDDFRTRLEELLPQRIDPTILESRYVPNLVARPFALTRDFLESILEVVPSTQVEAALSDLDGQDPAELCRLVLIELLAWQFASPVRWIETQDLMFAAKEDGGLGVERFIEVGVGQSPTVANLAASTLKIPEVGRTTSGPIEVLNVERDTTVVFARDEDIPEEPGEETDVAPAADADAQAASVPTVNASVGSAARPDDLRFAASDATRALLAWWMKLMPDQLGATDTIESLCDGVSSRRNQLLVDLGAELSLGAIDGAAEADLVTLSAQVNGLARGYKPLGPVLSVALADHLKKVLGPAGVRQAVVADRVTGIWQLGAGWATHALVELAFATREGAAPSSVSEVETAIDAAVKSVAARHGVSVDLPQTNAAVTVDAAALAGVTGEITDALASTARQLLVRLGVATAPAGDDVPVDEDAAAMVARVESELGRDWMTATAPAFDERRAVLLDDRWASAREDVARIALGSPVQATFDGAGPIVAAHARRAGLSDIADAAESTERGAWADDIAVVTGASRGSIAAAVVGRLLAGGATVIATTSSLDSDRLAFFKQLYRANARPGAALWVLPANMASFADVDAVVGWVAGRFRPTLLFPFAAGRVLGAAADAGSRAETEARILLWSVERLVGAEWGSDRVHVVLPGSPNRGLFGGDGAYGEAKAALDALVAKWSAERSWAERVSLVHAIIGWVRGTGLMGGNDPMVEAVEAAGVRTWTPMEMADELLSWCTPDARARATESPLRADLAAGLDGIDLRGLAVTPAPEPAEVDAEPTIAALPPSPAQLEATESPAWGDVPAAPEDMVVIVGAGELGPWGSSRTRYEMEVSGELSAAGVLELAWSTGLVRWDAVVGGWFDVPSGDAVAEHELHDRYHDDVMERCGIRSYADDGTMTAHSAPLLTSVFLEEDLSFTASEPEARAMRDADPEHTRIENTGDEWRVTRLAGTEIRVPRRMAITRTAGGQIPTGFDPGVWGIPETMLDSLDRVALWNLVCTVDAFLSSGFTPTELMRWVHPAKVANTQGTGMGGMTSMQSLYLDTLLGENTPNDLLQEALPNVIAAHVVQSYVGSYGAMVHPVAACATTAVSVEEGVDKIRLGKADFVVAGGFDDLGTEGVIGFANMSATADTAVMQAKGIELGHLSRANDRRRGGFVEAQGGGTLLLARGDVAARMGLPVLGVVGYAGSFADGIHTSIPAPGIGVLAAGLGGRDSALAGALAALGVAADDISVVSKHDTSTAANDPNESYIHERLAAALGRSDGNPLFVISQKSLTGHPKGGAAAFQLAGLCQVLAQGVLPPNRSLDCVDDVLAEHPHLVWLREPLATGPLKAGLVTSLGFGHVAGLIAVVHPEAFLQALTADEREAYLSESRRRRIDGRLRLARAMLGEPAYSKPAGRRLGDDEDSRNLETQLLLDADARLVDGVYACR